jgi:hypothetical protein
MIKNDQEYLSEWLTHHRELGVGHFYLYDNESTPRYENLGEDVTITYWDENYYFEPVLPKINYRYYDPETMANVEYTELTTTHWPNSPERDSKQFKAYQHCLNEYGDRHDWLAFLDSDEFINVAEGLDIRGALNSLDLPQLAQLLMKWRVFSSSGHLTKQPLQKEAYTDWYPDYQVKPFIKPDRIFAVKSLHILPVYPGFITMTEDGVTRTQISKHTHTSDIIWVNHYWSRSRQDFEETKLSRKGGTTLRYDEHYEAKYQFIEKRAAYHMKKLKSLNAPT